MRKHLLRILTVLLVVCLGAFLFVACGDTNDDNGDQGNGTQQGGEEQPKKYTLSFTGDTANVTITVDNKADNYAAGTTVKFSVTAKSGYTLVSVKNGTTTLEAQNGKYSVTLNANTTITVTTQTQQGGGGETQKYSVTMATNENVTFTIVEPTTAGPYAEGTTVKFTVTAKTGYKIDYVKNGETTLTAGSDGKYSVTVGKANIVITVTTSSSGSVAPEKYTLTFTGDTANVDIDIDNEADNYDAGTTVKFTVTAKSGYTLVSVKNGGVDVPKDTDNKYFVTLNANTTITITTSAQGGQTDNRNLTDFANASISVLGTTGIQVVVRAKAVGYADEAAVKADLRLVIGDTQIAPNTIPDLANNGVSTIYFNIETIPQGLTAKTQLTLKGVDSNKTYENIVTTVDGSAKVGNNTYTLSAEESKLYLNVATEQGGGDGGGDEEKVSKEIKQTAELNFYGENYFKLTVSNEDRDFIVSDVAYVKVNGAEVSAFGDNKGFVQEGETNVFQIFAAGCEKDTTQTKWTLVWYNEQDEPVAKTIAQRNWEPAPREGITNGGEGDSTDAWIYWNDDAEGAVTVTEVTLDEDETDGATVTAKFRSNTSVLDYGFQIFYNNTKDYTVGNSYRLTLSVTATSNLTLTINGQQYQLTANQATSVDVIFDYTFHLDNVVNYDYGMSLFDVKIPLAADTDYDVTFANIKWSKAPKYEYGKGELVAGTLSQDLVNGPEGEQKDKFILWWAKEAWDGCGTIVTLTPAVEEVYKDGKIAFTYKGGSVNFSVQLFYSNTKLQDNTKYYLTLKIKLTAAADVNIIVNGKPVTLKAGQVNDVEVLFVNTTETAGDKGISSLDIQFPGTETVDGVDSIGIEITDVAWYNVKTGGSDVEPDTVVTFDTNDGSEVDSKSYADGAKFSTDKPADPTKADHTFLYWYYLEGEQETKVDDDFIPSAHATDHALTLYAKWAEHTYPDGADSHGNYVCTTCGAILHPGDAVGTVAEVPAQMTGLDTKGLSASFWLHAANNDWDAIGLWTNFGKFKIALPNIQANNQGTDVSSDETIAALRTKIGNGTCFPSSVGAQMLNGAEWNAICAATEVYVTITVGPNAINFYKNGVQVFSYPATMTFVGTTAEGTMGDFIKAFLLSAQKEGVTVAVPEHAYGGFISAENVLVEYGKVYTTEQAKALYDNYLVEKELYPKAHSVHTYVNGKCSVCGYTCPHTFTAEEGECSVCHQFVGKQLHTETYGELKNGFADNSKMYTMNKPESGKTLEVVFTATIATHVQVSDQDVMKYMAYQGIVTRIYDATTEEAFLQGNRFELEDKPWLSKTEANRNLNLADYGNNNRVGFFYRVTVLWTDANITVTYEAWTPKDDLNQGADLSSTITFTGVEKDTYNVFFGLDGMTSTDGKLVVNEYSAKA